MYRVEKINDYAYHIEDQIDNPSSMYCLIGSQKVLWIDASNKHEEDEAELQAIINELSQGKECIFAITHNHFDHTGEINLFKGHTVYFPANDIDDEFSWCTSIEDGQVIDLGDLKVEAVEVPGHTKGSMVYIEPVHQFVATGDAIGSSYVWLFFMDNILENYKKGIHHLYDRIHDYDEPIFLCGHRHQQYPSPTRDPLSPVNDSMTMQYLLDMIELVRRIENKTALTRPYPMPRFKEPCCVYSFEGSKCEIDSFESLMK